MTSFADLTLIALIVTGASGAAPASVTPDAAWDASVAGAIGARWNVPAGAVRLDWGRLPPQGMPPAPVAPLRLMGGADGWFVLAVDAQDGPIAVRVRAGLDDSVCVATHDLTRGERLEDGDLRRELRVRWGSAAARGAAERPAGGWTVRRPIVAGTLVDRSSVEPPQLVSAGQRIELWWQRGGVALRLSGIALHGARLGETVRVRVEGRARPLTGVIDAPGRARIGIPEAS